MKERTKRNERNGKEKGKHTGREPRKVDHRTVSSEKRCRYAGRFERHFRTDVWGDVAG